MLTRLLSRSPAAVLNLYAVTVAFATYFCMYAFRKPFAAATYQGLYFLGSEIELKTVFVVSQILGYALSKYLGIKYCSEITRDRRAWMLVSLIVAAESALVLFAVVPVEWKVVAIFLNGLPLGMVWGLVVWYLEGRRTSEILLAGLSCSFILASGVVKDVGRALMAGDSIPIVLVRFPNPFPEVAEFWMPAATGLLFFPPLLVSVWLLNQVPDPTPEDVAARTARQPMNRHLRALFFRRYLPGIVMLVVAYFFLTAYRDFRDNYQVDLLGELGFSGEDHVALISKIELGVALGVMVAMSLLFLIKDNRRGLAGVFIVMGVGFLLMGVASLAIVARAIDGVAWMVLIGLGSYLAYVPYNSVLFDRLMATTRFMGTAVFAIYVADAWGYTGSIGLQLFKDLVVGDASRVEFMVGYSCVLSLLGVAMMLGSAWYFLLRRSTSHV
jgi:hypothetical protein